MKVETDRLKTDEQYQRIPGLTDEEYWSLRQDIKENGIKQPLDVDESNTVLDGHHRLKVAKELVLENVPVKRYSDLSESEKEDWQFTANANRRNMGEKRTKQTIEARLKVLDNRGEERDDNEIATDCATVRQYVGDVRRGMSDSGKLETGFYLATQDTKRTQAEQYVRENPDASNREVADNTPVSRTTAGTIKDEIESGDGDDNGDAGSSERSDGRESPSDDADSNHESANSTTPTEGDAGTNEVGSSDGRESTGDSDDDDNGGDDDTEKVEPERLGGDDPVTENGKRRNDAEAVIGATQEMIDELEEQIDDRGTDDGNDIERSAWAYRIILMVQEHLLCPECGDENISVSLDCCGQTVTKEIANSALEQFEDEVMHPAAVESKSD